MHDTTSTSKKQVAYFVASTVLAVTTLVSSSFGAVATRFYDFEEGAAGSTTTVVDDITTDFLFQSDSDALWGTGHFWIEVSAATPRPLPDGGLSVSVLESALEAPALEAVEGLGTYEDVSDGTAFDSPAIGSQLALRFDGDGYFNDENTAGGSRGVYVEVNAFTNDEPMVKGSGADGNTAESFNLITQGWAYPTSDGEGIAQTIWRAGNEQGSVNITPDGFWEFRDLGSVGTLNPGVPVDFDNWTHFGIRRGGNGAEVFINGELADGNINPNPANWFNTFASVITLGGNGEGTDGFVGLVDDFQVMGTADVSWDPMVDLDFWAQDTTERPACDLDGNGSCELADLDILLYEGISSQSANFDLNSDGVVDVADRNEWLSITSAEAGTQFVAGDANLDGQVIASDLNILGTNWGRTDATSVAQGDFNGDGKVDATDLNEVGLNWQFGAPAAAAPAAVPEPGGMALLAPLAFLLFVRRKTVNRS